MTVTAWAAARDATLAKQNRRLTRMLSEAIRSAK